MHSSDLKSSLSTSSLSKHFGGIKAVNNASLSFEAGKITGVIGPNGSGKSTLINLLSGMTPFDRGHLILLGKEKISKLAPDEAPDIGITRTFQEVRLFEQMTVLDNILVVVTEKDWSSALFENHSAYHLTLAEEALKKVGMQHFAHKNAAELSYGQRKLIEIARVLAMKSVGKANIFFFDEPFAGLFPEMVKVVVSVMKELRDEGYTLVLVEHNMDLIRELSDTVIVMDSGEVLATGLPHEVLARKEVIEAYLGE